MPRGSKKRRAAAKKKQENRPINPSSSSTRSPGNGEDTKHRDEKQSDVVLVEKESTVEDSIKPNDINGEPTGESNNGGGSSSSSSGNSSDDDVRGTKSSVPSEDISSVEEVETILYGSEKIPLMVEKMETISYGLEKIPLLVEKVETESLLEDNEISSNLVGDNVGTSVVRNKESIPLLVEKVETISCGSEEIPLLVEKVKNESLLEDNEMSPNLVGDNVGTSVVRNKESIVQSDNRAEQENDSTVTEPLLKDYTVTEPLLVPEKEASWGSCCGLFDVFSGSRR